MLNSQKINIFALRHLKLVTMGKYINPFTDWGFKRLFGQEFSKDLLISFLNDLLVGELQVKYVFSHFPYYMDRQEFC